MFSLHAGSNIYRYSALLGSLILTILLVLPGDSFPKTDIISADKIVHILIFGGVSFCFYMWSNDRSKNIWILLAGISYGVIIEFIQEYWCINRSFSYADMVADGLGCIIAYFISRVYIKR